MSQGKYGGGRLVGGEHSIPRKMLLRSNCGTAVRRYSTGNMTKSSKNIKEARTDLHSEFITFLFRILLRSSLLTKRYPVSYFVWAVSL